MDDLISREEFDEILDEYEGMKAHSAFTEGIMVARRELASIRSIEAEPVRHGMWVNQDDTYTRWYCSECKSGNHAGGTNYCPNCGAKMDLEG